MDELIELLKTQQELYFELSEAWAGQTGRSTLTPAQVGAAIYSLVGQDIVTLIAFAETVKAIEEAKNG